MAGLPNNIYSHIMDEWYRLFLEQNCTHSSQKYQYWKNIKHFGFPDIKDEKWKHFPLSELFFHTFKNASPQKNINVSDRDKLSLNLKAYRLVFINGFFSKQLSDQNTGPWKVDVFNRNTYKTLPKPIQPEIFIYLTECLSYETVCISLPNNKISKIPLYLLHIGIGSNNKNTLITFHYRHHIEICDNAIGQIIEHFASIDKNKYFNGARTSIIVGTNSQIEHTKLSLENHESYHISHNDISVNYNSTIQSNLLNIFSNRLNRNQISIILNDKYASCFLNSLLLPIKQNIHDISTYVKHKKPGYNSSKQIHKIILGDKGQGIFRGLIKVDKQAKKIDGIMINKNLLLKKSSKIYSTPQLEIYSDDIKCTHGTTIGYIDQEQIFYLCTRGISYNKACQMVIYAFAFEILEMINNNDIKKQTLSYITNILTRTLNNGVSYKKNSI